MIPFYCILNWGSSKYIFWTSVFYILQHQFDSIPMSLPCRNVQWSHAVFVCRVLILYILQDELDGFCLTKPCYPVQWGHSFKVCRIFILYHVVVYHVLCVTPNILQGCVPILAH